MIITSFNHLNAISACLLYLHVSYSSVTATTLKSSGSGKNCEFKGNLEECIQRHEIVDSHVPELNKEYTNDDFMSSDKSNVISEVFRRRNLDSFVNGDESSNFEDLLQRQKFVDAYFSGFNEIKKGWVDSYYPYSMSSGAQNLWTDQKSNAAPSSHQADNQKDFDPFTATENMDKITLKNFKESDQLVPSAQKTKIVSSHLAESDEIGTHSDGVAITKSDEIMVKSDEVVTAKSDEIIVKSDEVVTVKYETKSDEIVTVKSKTKLDEAVTAKSEAKSNEIIALSDEVITLKSDKIMTKPDKAVIEKEGKNTFQPLKENYETILQNKKIMEEYFAKFNEEKKQWIDSYYPYSQTPESENFNQYLNVKHAISLNTDDIHKNMNLDINTIIDKMDKTIFEHSKENSFEPVLQIDCIRYRLYLIRWLKSLLNASKKPYFKENFVALFNDEIFKKLEKITSENFDIENVDELITKVILNAIEYESGSWFNFSISNYYVIFTICSIISILGILILSFLVRSHSFYVLLTLCIIGIIFGHYCKMYQEAVARKHAALSRVPTLECENRLTAESGLYDHIKQYIRHSFYDEQCKKYYEELMVDPLLEINILNVIVDLLSSAFFQLFYPLAKTINYFIKATFFDMSYKQIFIAILLIFFVLLLIFNYKIKLPFWLGSIEPVAVLIGSHVEDINVPKKKSIFNILWTNTYEKFKTDSYIESKNSDSFIQNQDEVNNITLNQNETLPFLHSKLDFIDRKISSKILKFCKECNEVLLTNLASTCDEKSENVFESYTEQSCIPSSELQSCYRCSIQFQTILCDKMLLECQDFPIKVISEPCLHLKFICLKCTKSMQRTVSNDEGKLHKD